MDVVLVGLPGSGKTAVARRLARRHEAELVDLDEVVEREAGARIPEIFAEEGEAGFRARERAAIEAIPPPDPQPMVRRVVASGGGAVVDPRNRWRLYRGRLPIWLDVRPEVLVQRLRRSHNVRPLVASSPDPLAAVQRLRSARERFYAAAVRVEAVAAPGSVLERIDQAAEAWAAAAVPRPTILLDGATTGGRLIIGDGVAADGIERALQQLGAGRALLVSEPGAWHHAGEPIRRVLERRGRTVEVVLLPQGEAAKRLDVIEEASRDLVRLRVERGEPLVAIGGGALGDAAGFLAAVWLRGVPIVHVPTTLVAQIDSSIGGKTAVDLPEGKNLVGAFHQPAAIVTDVGLLRTLPARQLRAALGEAVKMGVLGDARLVELLESRGPAMADGDPPAFEDGSIAELVERCAWAKVEVVARDERETAGASGRITLNLGHTYAHGLETADGYAQLLHGEAVAYGLRGALRLGVASGVTPPARAERIERLLDGLALATTPLPYPPSAVLDALALDKKHAGGHQRWVLPSAEGVTVRSDVPEAMVQATLGSLLSGRAKVAAASTAAGSTA